jgi:hypothetical protein
VNELARSLPDNGGIPAAAGECASPLRLTSEFGQIRCLAPPATRLMLGLLLPIIAHTMTHAAAYAATQFTKF